MKRNSKILLLLALLMSGIIAVYFIGCGGDETTIIEPTPPDRVIGSVHGVVANMFDNTALPNVKVSWVSHGETRTVTTDSLGYFLTDDVLGSGEYGFTFSVNGYATFRASTDIPDIDSLRGEPGTPVSGDIPFSRQMNAWLLPLNANLTGKVYTSQAIAAPGKETERPMATDSADLVSPVPDVEVILDYSGWDTVYQEEWWWGDSLIYEYWVAVYGWWDIVPNKYQAFTNQDGEFTFDNVPWAPFRVQLQVKPFTVGDSSYADTTVAVKLIHNGTYVQPNIYAPLDCTDIPQVLRLNLSEVVDFHYDSTIKITFSEPMDRLSFSVDIEPTTTASLAWTLDDQVLEIIPALPLETDEDYEVTLRGKSRDGCPTAGRTWYLNFTTKDGIYLVISNLEEYNFQEFPIDSPIVLTFNMLPVINPLTGQLLLEDRTDSPYRQVGIDSSVNATTNQVSVTPDNPLERDHTYRLTYMIHSQVQGDYVSGYLEFSTEFDPNPPLAVTGFDLYMGTGWTADWNDTLIDFRWNTVSNATGYRIYAKDNKLNTDFVVVGDFDQKDYLTYQTGEVVIPAQFDLYDDDGSLQTPFSGGTVITFDIRAYNRAGEGPFTGSPKTVADETPPSFDLYVCGSADNYLGTTDSVITFSLGGDLEYCQETSNPVFVFTEAGGDSAYVLPATAGDWDWYSNLRNGSGTITVPADMVAAGDDFTLEITDNSGNTGSYTVRLRPTIDFVTPNTADTTFEAQWGRIEWQDTAGCDVTSMDYFNIYISWDNGATWIDTIEDETSSYLYSLDDTLIVDGTGLIGLEDYDNPGFRWLSEPFTVNGIMITSPDSASYFGNTDTILDGGNTDSTEVPLAWNSTAFISEVMISYSNNGVNWFDTDTIANAGSFNFVPPSRGAQYNCWLRVSDADTDGRPRNATSWYFTVLHDTIIWDEPDPGDVVTGGSIVYNIRWDNGVFIDTLPSILDLYWAIDPATDTTWTSLATGTENDGFYTWDTVPYASPSTNALIKIEAQDGTEYIGGFFTISGLTITAPVGGEDWDVGSSQNITWNNIGGFSGNVSIDYTTNNGTTWANIVTDIVNTGSYTWNPVPNFPSNSCLVKVTEYNGLITNTSDSTFTIAGILVTLPNGGETWLVGRIDTVQWSIVGLIGDTVGIVFSTDKGATYDDTITKNAVANSGLFELTVPAIAGPFPIDTCLVEVYDIAGTATDTSNAVFTIDQPNITVTYPNVVTDTLQMGNVYNITWTSVGLQTDTLIITLSIDGGTTFPTEIVRLTAATTSYNWTVPNLGGSPINTCQIRVAEKTYPLHDESDANFVIIP